MKVRHAARQMKSLWVLQEAGELPVGELALRMSQRTARVLIDAVRLQTMTSDAAEILERNRPRFGRAGG